MLFSKLALAILPALALAEPGLPEETTTVTSTTKLTKTVYLAEHTVTSAWVEQATTVVAHNSTTPVATPSKSSTKVIQTPTSAGTTGAAPKPSTVNGNTATGLHAGGFLLVGAAGMAALALL